MSGWSRAALTQNDVVGPELHRLTLQVPEAVRRGFHVPGQYHRVRTPSGLEATFAIASPPGGPAFEYLIRAHGGAAQEVATLPVGAHLEVQPPEGPGFPLDEARGRNLLLVGTGTGFAPLRSALLHLSVDRTSFGRVLGAYGVLTPAHLAFGAELAQWAAAGLHITPIVTTATPDWSGKVGLVQSLLDAFPLDDTVAFLCGQPEMTQDVSERLVARGLPAERVFLNLPK